MNHGPVMGGYVKLRCDQCPPWHKHQLLFSTPFLPLEHLMDREGVLRVGCQSPSLWVEWVAKMGVTRVLPWAEAGFSYRRVQCVTWRVKSKVVSGQKQARSPAPQATGSAPDNTRQTALPWTLRHTL